MRERLLDWLDPFLVRIGQAIADRMTQRQRAARTDYTIRIRDDVDLRAFGQQLRDQLADVQRNLLR